MSYMRYSSFLSETGSKDKTVSMAPLFDFSTRFPLVLPREKEVLLWSTSHITRPEEARGVSS